MEKLFEKHGWFAPGCRRCRRLAAYLEATRDEYPDYHCRPVPPFGDPKARLLVVGLAPGKHGANATGRPFTGDYAGVLLYRTLHRYGFSDRPVSAGRDDGLRMTRCRITNAVKCLPPENKPTTEEVRNCREFLEREIDDMPPDSVILSLGAVAHNAVLRCAGLRPADLRFAHGAYVKLGTGMHLLSSYHCSRYNTQTGRLSTEMFEAVVERASLLLDS
jgi:uracil-DNA glycosylase family 4